VAIFASDSAIAPGMFVGPVAAPLPGPFGLHVAGLWLFFAVLARQAATGADVSRAAPPVASVPTFPAGPTVAGEMIAAPLTEAVWLARAV
jgi:hypothetical protein